MKPSIQRLKIMWGRASKRTRIIVVVAAILILLMLIPTRGSNDAPAADRDVSSPQSAPQIPSLQSQSSARPAATQEDSDEKNQGLCDGHLLSTPDGAHEEIDWDTHYQRTEREDGAVTYRAATWMLDNHTTAKYSGGGDIECTVRDGRVIRFERVE